MFESTYDPKRPYRYTRYGRMSHDQQNPRSPEQQFQTIGDVAKRHGFPWILTTDYRDNGMKGRYRYRRPGFQQLMRDIQSGQLQVDLIAVDTIERFARLDELPEIRRELQYKHGVLVVTADTNFTDPTSRVGKMCASFEAVRATEDGRIKAHNVMRGKRDLVLRKRWPGG